VGHQRATLVRGCNGGGDERGGTNISGGQRIDRSGGVNTIDESGVGR
jgi:hypothetical protein